MTDQHLDLADRKKTERRLLASALLKYTAVFLGVVWMATMTVQNLNTTEAIRDTQQEGSPAVQAATDAAESAEEASVDTKDLLLQFQDCIKPQGKCFKAGQQRSAETVASVNEITIAAASCAAGFAELPEDQRVIETQACVIRTLAERSDQ